MYLTQEEFTSMGFQPTDDFWRLYPRASTMIDLYTNNFYSHHDFEEDFEPRKKAVKQAVALQIAYMDDTGITSAEDKQHLANISIGRTSVSYGGSGSTRASNKTPYGLTLDALNLLNSAGFGYRGVSYDR